MPIAKLTLFTVSKDKWDTKEGTGKSMKTALHKQWCSKRHLLAEAMSNSKKIKSVALAIVKLQCMRVWRQAGRQASRQAGRQAGRQAENSVNLIPQQLFESI